MFVTPASFTGFGRRLTHDAAVQLARNWTALLLNGIVLVIAGGTNHMALVHRRDLARLYVLALGARAGASYLGVGESDVTGGQVAEAASRAAGAGGATKSLSIDEARQVWGPLADALALDQQFTARRARDELEWVPQEAGVLEYLADSAVHV